MFVAMHIAAPGRFGQDLLLPCTGISPSARACPAATCLTELRTVQRRRKVRKNASSNAGAESCMEPDRDISTLLRQRQHVDEDEQGGVTLANGDH